MNVIPVLARLLILTLVLGALTPCRAYCAEDLEQQEEAAFKAAVKAIAPSVVRIETFGGQEKVGNVLVGTGPTTGLIVSSQGHIVSSAFNFVQKPSSILVTLADGKRSAAQIVARDQSRMLVLLKVAVEGELPVPTAVPREEMSVGQWTLAIGRTFDQPLPSLSIGVLSAKSRVWGKAIQCDAKISPSNYGGPLVDIQGRVLGILVPMTPQGQGEVAGAEWYDSGIGFAVPLEDVFARLDKLKAGEDQHPGLLGISLQGSDIYNDPAILVAAQANGPAAKGGLKPQDQIIEIDRQKIERQAQLKHALGPKYAGDTVHVVALRDEERIEVDIQLVDKLAAYQHPFLGILPIRTKLEQPGIGVRHVYPSSGAAEAGLQIDDRITALGETPVADAKALADALAAFEPGQKIVLKYERAGEAKSAEVTLGVQPTTIPAELPPPHGKELPPPDMRPITGVVDIKVPEEKNQAVAYVPAGYHAEVPQGVLVVLCEPGKFKRDELIATYQAICDKYDTILLLVRSAETTKWDAADAIFIRKAIEQVIASYNVDRTRIALLGYQTSGSMAYATAFLHPDLIRAVAAIEAVLPQRIKAPDNEPARRWSIYSAYATRSPQKSGLDASLKHLQERQYPVVMKSTGEKTRELDADELIELGRWLDSLDRL